MAEVKKTRAEQIAEHAARLAEHGIKPPEHGDLNDRWLERGAKIAPFAYSVSDRTTGLLITVKPNGTKIWQLQATYPGQQMQARRKLGVYQWPHRKGQDERATMSLKDARTKAVEWLAQVKAGVDPEDAAREKAEAARQAKLAKAQQNRQTFAAFAETFISGRTNRRAAADGREIRRLLVPELGPRPLHSITPDDILQLMRKLVLRAPYDARNGWGHASVIFREAVEAKLIAASPLASLSKKKFFRGKTPARQRALTDEELRAFWWGTDKLGPPYSAFFRVLLLTGARLNEIAQARRVELDPALRKALRDATQTKTPVDWQTLPDKIKILRVPAERFKSDREHSIQLSSAALDIIAELPRGDFLFSTSGSTPINGLSKAKRRLDELMLKYLRDEAAARDEDPTQVQLPPWVIHDLRRTVRTGLAALKVPFEIAETVLGHTLGGLHATYNRHGYGPEIREALERWAVRLREIVEPQAPAPTTADNVVTIQRKRAVS